MAPPSSVKRTPIRQQSDRRRSERDERAEIVRRAVAAEGGQCGLWWLADPVLAARAGLEPEPCFGDLVGHEIAHRSVKPGSHLEEELVVALCVGHNRWEDVQTNTDAQDAGVRASAWCVDQYGAVTVAAECRRIRWARSRGQDPGPPFWRGDDAGGEG